MNIDPTNCTDCKAEPIETIHEEVVITNRWSSRLGCRSGPVVFAGKEPSAVGVVGGAAQLYVRWIEGI